MDTEQLKKIGLDELESRVYLSLLQLQDALVSDIAEKTKLNRSSLYSILTKLCEKGIVTYILRNNTRYYRAAEPQKLLAMIREKEDTLRKIMPELIALHKPMSKKPIIEILEGKEGIKTLLNDILHERKTWQAYSAGGHGRRVLGPLVDLFEKERENKKIVMLALMIKQKEAYKRAEEFRQMKYSQVRFMPRPYESLSSTWIYSDRICIIFWYEEYPFAMRIIDKKLSESYKEHFNMLWEIAERE